MRWANIAIRIRSQWKVKLFLTLVLNFWFYFPYLFLQRHQLFPPTEVLPTFVDRMIPFWPNAVWLYLSLYLLIPIGPLLMSDRLELVRFGLGIFLIGAVAYVVFLFWPTWCARPLGGNDVFVYQILIGIDRPWHALPSLHAAFGVFCALCGGSVLAELRTGARWIGVLWLWTALILLATLLTKQHMVPDIIAGSGLGFGVFFGVFRCWKPQLSRVLFSVVSKNQTQTESNTL
jgi:membrane-associated phospholipid phosphatase